MKTLNPQQKVIIPVDMNVCWNSMGITQDEWNNNWEFKKDNFYVINNSLWCWDEGFCGDGELVQHRLSVPYGWKDENKEFHHTRIYGNDGCFDGYLYQEFGLQTEGGNIHMVGIKNRLQVINLEEFKESRDEYLMNLDRQCVGDNRWFVSYHN